MGFDEFKIDSIKPLNREEERELIKKSKQGDKEATERIINSHLGYIYKMAIEYSKDYGVSIDELVDEGILALFEAIKRFDLKKRVRLLTFASYYIENAMKKYASEQAHSIKVPLDYREKLAKILRVIEEFKQTEEREPTIEEIARILNMRPETVRRTLNEYRGEFSLEELEVEEDKRIPEEKFNNPHQVSLSEEIKSEISLENILKLLKEILDEREFKIISEYYGLFGIQSNFEKLAKELNISKERVRQIKEKAIRKLRFIYGDKLKEIFYDKD